MRHVLVLDSGPLDLITHSQRSSAVLTITNWLAQCIQNGHRILVPAIVYYELKRELLRLNKEVSVARMDAFVNTTPGRYLPLSDEALRLAATLWAVARKQGKPTADPKALDVDVILAAQVLSLGPLTSELTVITTNPNHLGMFVRSCEWQQFEP